MKYWLIKNEPDCYSIDDLKRDKVEIWDGVRNYQVRNMMRNDMKKGNAAIFYHSNAGKETGAVGVMTICKEAYVDPTQFDPKSEHPDPKSSRDNPRWLAVDVRYKKKLKRLVSLQEMKEVKALHGMKILQKGNRLSITPITKTEFDKIVALSEK
jgi:predicted RNA-binding protein with PUA-like domain